MLQNTIFNKQSDMATVKERIIKRLNKGFGFDIPLDAHWHTHERAFRDCGGMSWYFSDLRLGHLENCGAADTASECLKWKKWCIDTEEAEIFEFFEHLRERCMSEGYLIEGEN